MPTGGGDCSQVRKGRELPTFRWDLKRPSRGFSSGPSSFFLGAMAATTFQAWCVRYPFEARGLTTEQKVWTSGLQYLQVASPVKQAPPTAHALPTPALLLLARRDPKQRVVASTAGAMTMRRRRTFTYVSMVPYRTLSDCPLVR